jgi:hypothetical protein
LLTTAFQPGGGAGGSHLVSWAGLTAASDAQAIKAVAKRGMEWNSREGAKKL